MHDYVKGAYEALSWIHVLLKEQKEISQIQKEIENALNDINEGVAIDFRDKLRPIRY